MKPMEAGAKANAVTQLLMSWNSGSKEALDSLTPIVYDELCRLADHSRQHKAAKRGGSARGAAVAVPV